MNRVTSITEGHLAVKFTITVMIKGIESSGQSIGNPPLSVT